MRDAPLRPRPTTGRAGSPSSRAATQPAQLSRIAGYAAHPGPARAGRRHVRRKFRDGRAVARLGQHCSCLAALAERLMLRLNVTISMLRVLT